MKKLISLAVLAATAVGVPVSSALAAESNSPWMLRVRGIQVDPEVSSTTITTIGGKVNDISTESVPELDINYFFNKNVALELILATSKHEVGARGTALDGASGSPAGKTKLGAVNLLPPTLTAQYHFFPEASFSPYLGVGVNYTHFYNENASRNIAKVKYENSFGAAFQAGADLKLDNHWSVNVDVKKVYVNPDVTVTALSGARVHTSVDINPMIYGLGVGYHF